MDKEIFFLESEGFNRKMLLQMEHYEVNFSDILKEVEDKKSFAFKELFIATAKFYASLTSY